jgi:hypothetical protein
MVNSFFWGDFHRAYNEKDQFYPLVCSYLSDGAINTNMTQIQLVVIVCDKTFKGFENLNDTESDTVTVARHLFNVIKQSPRWNALLRVNSATLSKFIENTRDEVAGVILTMNVDVKQSRSLCDLPLDGYDFDGTFVGNECEPVLIVNSNQTFTFSAASGTIVELPDTPVTVFDQDGNELGSSSVPSVTGGTVEVEITPDPCDPATFEINGVEVATIPSGGSDSIQVRKASGSAQIGALQGQHWRIPNSQITVKDTANNTLSTTNVPATESAEIVAPDGTVTVNRDGILFATQAVRSGGTATVNVPQEDWRRPLDWLPMPTVTSAQQTFVGLHAVIEDGDNYVAFLFTTSTGDYQVDWGDGTVTTHASNTNAEHQYDFATYDPTNATLTSRGYKQAMITVTPVSGDLLTCNFQQRYVTVPAQTTAYSTGFLDCILSMPNASSGASIVFGGATIRHAYVERVNVLTIGNVTVLLSTFVNCSNLKSVPLFDTQNVLSMQLMFSQSGIEKIPLFNTSNVTSMNSMFNVCSLKEIPLLDTSNVTDFFRFLRITSVKNIPLLDTSEGLNMSEFLASTPIQSVPLLDTSKATNMSAMFDQCNSINSIPALSTAAITSDFTNFARSSNSLNRCQMVFQRTVSFANCQLSRDAIVEIFNNLAVVTSATITITGNSGVTALSAADLLIATSKGWTVVQ